MVVKEELTKAQTLALEQLRVILRDILQPKHDDTYLLRFLVARKFDVDAATTMLEKHIQKFKDHGYDDTLSNYIIPEKFHYFCSAVLGFDDEGSLVKLVADTDYIGLAMSYPKQETLAACIFYLERDLLLQRKQGSGEKVTYIVDAKCITWRCLLCKPMARNVSAWFKMYEANYPETLKMVYFINTPASFEYLFNFMEKYLNQDIMKKMCVLSPDQVGPMLTSIMPSSILPAYLGGTRTDPEGDPHCYTLFPIKPGTPVPEKFYVAAQADSLDHDPEAKKVTIKKKSSFVLTFLVDSPDTVISWDFKTASNDIGIGLYFRKLGKSELVELIPIRRVDSHKFVESGKYFCKECGTYELTFSNLYSVLTKKVLTYTTKILKPGEVGNKIGFASQIENKRETPSKK